MGMFGAVQKLTVVCFCVGLPGGESDGEFFTGGKEVVALVMQSAADDPGVSISYLSYVCGEKKKSD